MLGPIFSYDGALGYFSGMLTVALLGTGNLGKHLQRALVAAEDVELLQWYGRNIHQLQLPKTSVELISDLDKLKQADVFLLAIKDDAIADVSSKITEDNRLVVHTSGSVNIHDLDKKHRRGVFYPLQTFSEESTFQFKEVPICIEALEKSDLTILKKLAESLGCSHQRINTEQRQTIHLAAVYVNNFVNQLYRVGHEITDAKSVDFNLLKPLIKETAQKLDDMSPYQAQTGPAIRSDKKTIKKHRKMIKNKTHLEIYDLLTKAIKTTHGR